MAILRFFGGAVGLRVKGEGRVGIVPGGPVMDLRLGAEEASLRWVEAERGIVDAANKAAARLKRHGSVKLDLKRTVRGLTARVEGVEQPSREKDLPHDQRVHLPSLRGQGQSGYLTWSLVC